MRITTYIFSSPERSLERGIALLWLRCRCQLEQHLNFYVQVFYVMGKVLTGKLFCPVIGLVMDIYQKLFIIVITIRTNYSLLSSGLVRVHLSF